MTGRGLVRAGPLRTLLAALFLLAACGGEERDGVARVTISGSAVGAEGKVLASQIARFRAANRDVEVTVQHTPDDATQRHQLYVQWLNARVGRPDVLQLDVVWTAEFAAAGWIRPLDSYQPDSRDFFPATVTANTWDGRLYAVPWFVDAGVLYRRTDLVPEAPRSLDDLVRSAAGRDAAWGLVWQGARYEGLVTVFLEYLTAFGGAILDDEHRVVVDSAAGVRALTFMRDQIVRWRVAPPDVLTWHEEETRFAFQNGRAAFMRNWPYAVALLNGPDSRVAGRFAVGVMPPGPGGRAAATLGGAQLAINAHSAHPEAAWRLIAFLTAPEQMIERAGVVGQYPSRVSVLADPRLAEALPVPIADVRAILQATVPRPVTPLYSQLSDVLQIELHRALAGQLEPRAALRRAAAKMEAVIAESGIRERGRGNAAAR